MRVAGVVALTSREKEVLRWVAAGKTDRQIASIFGASSRTIQKHLEHVYVNLGVENRTGPRCALYAGATVRVRRVAGGPVGPSAELSRER